MKMAQGEVWYNKLGFYNNPFSIKPAAFHSEIVGYDVDEISSRIESGGFLFILGPMGVGKTTILKNILARFGGKGKVIYCSANTSDSRISFRALLIGSGFFSRLFSSPAKDMILLVDEAQDLKKQESVELFRLFRKGNFRSVVFFGTEHVKEKFPDELNSLLKDNVKVLARLKGDHAVELVRKRIGDIPLISDQVIRRIYSRSGFNARRLLENCEDVMRHAVELGAEKVTVSHVNDVVKVERRPVIRQGPRIVIEQIEDVDIPVQPRPGRKPRQPQLNVRTYEEEMSTVRTNVDEEV